jgi:hypothetical protein
MASITKSDFGLPTIEFPRDMKFSIEQLVQSARGTDDSVRACGGISPTMRAAWGSFYIGLLDFAADNANPGPLDMVGGLIQRANSYQQQLLDWQKNKIGQVCQLALPPLQSAPPKGQSTGEKVVDGVTSVLKWATIAGATIGGIYVVGKAIALIPPAAPRRA